MRCFLQWFVLCLSYIVAAFFATYFGCPQAIWHADMTHMTSVIAILFVADLRLSRLRLVALR